MPSQRTLVSPRCLSLAKLSFTTVTVGVLVKWSHCTTGNAQFVQVCTLKMENTFFHLWFFYLDKIERKIEDPRFETFVVESTDTKLEMKEEITQPPDQSDLLNKCETSSDTSKEERIDIKTEVEDVKGVRQTKSVRIQKVKLGLLVKEHQKQKKMFVVDSKALQFNKKWLLRKNILRLSIKCLWVREK